MSGKPKTTRIILRNSQLRHRARIAILELPEKPIYEVIIRPYKKDRTLAQNRLMWMWHTEYAEYFGVEKKEDQHEVFKENHVLPILLRDDEDGRLTRMYELCRQDPMAKSELISLLSTTHLSTGQFSEALDEYDRVTASKGLCFTHPEDRYYEAMARRWAA